MTQAINKEDKHLRSLMANHTQKLMDDFFVHQCIVRRFCEKNRDVFEKLVSFRNQLELIVKKDLGCPIAQAHVVYQIMNTMQKNKVLSLLKNNELNEGKDIIFEMVEPINNIFQTEIEELLEDDTINEIIELMGDSVSMIFDIMNTTNVFRYYNIYASTIIVDFEDLIVIQKLAEIGKIPTTIFAEKSPPLTKWLSLIYRPLGKSTEQIFEDLKLGSTYRDLYCLIECQGVIRKFNSENIQIIDDRIGDIVINGRKSDGRLYLSVPYTKLPTDIDEALRLFKNSINERLIDEGVYRYNTEDEDYWQSKFYNKNNGANTPNSRGDTSIVLVKQKNSFLKLQSGLLVWDKVKRGKDTIGDSLEKSSNFIEKYEAYSRSESSIKKDYDYIAALINADSKSGKNILSKILSKRNDVVIK